MGRAPKGKEYSNHPFSGAMLVSGRVVKIADEKLNTLVNNEKPSQLFVSQLEMKTQNWGETFYIGLKLQKKTKKERSKGCPFAMKGKKTMFFGTDF